MAASNPNPSGPSYAERVRAELRVRCVWLKTKAAFFPLPVEGDVENPSPTGCWWCERTGEGLGPDGSFADPKGCDDARGRACYQAPVRL